MRKILYSLIYIGFAALAFSLSARAANCDDIVVTFKNNTQADVKIHYHTPQQDWTTITIAKNTFDAIQAQSYNSGQGNAFVEFKVFSNSKEIASNKITKYPCRTAQSGVISYNPSKSLTFMNPKTLCEVIKSENKFDEYRCQSVPNPGSITVEIN